MPSSNKNISSPLSPCSTRCRAFLQLLVLRLRAVTHQLLRQLALERGLDGRHERRRILVAPRRVLVERLAEPLLEVDDAGLRHEVPVVVVDPVPRERAGADELALRRAVDVDRQLQRRPRRRRLPLHEGRLADTRRGAGTPVQPPPVCTNVTDVSVTTGSRWMSGYAVRGEGHLLLAEAQRGRADHAAAGVAVAEDLAGVAHVDPGAQHVGEAELVGVAQLGEVVDVVRAAARRSGRCPSPSAP